MAVLPVGIGSAEEGGFQIERSLRFNSADSAYLNRTPASAGNRKTWTWSGWVKRSALGSAQSLFAVNATTDYNDFRFTSSDTLLLYLETSALVYAVEVPTVVWRDPSAWYHIILAVDTTQATAGNRVKIYVNGVQQTVAAVSGFNLPAQNFDTYVNATLPHAIGVFNYNNTAYFNGYLTEINFIDGQALDPTDFGEFNQDTGVWQPIEYTGTYGTNGFYLNFSDNSGTTSTTLGADSSGNGNNWTPNNFSVTAGAGNDSLVDSPTRYGTDTGAGGEVRGNYATLNALLVGSSTTLNNGNLDSAATADNWNTTFGTIFASSGKWYAEVTVISVSADYSAQRVGVGFARSTTNLIGTASSFLGANTLEGAYFSNGNAYTNSTTNIVNATYNTNDVIGVALDMDAGTVTFYKNNSVQPGTFTGLSGLNCIAVSHFGSGAKVVINFGQRPFAYTAPSGFKALCTTNLPEPTIADGGEYFNTVLWTGDGNNPRTVTGVGFGPDFVWIKSRSLATSHLLNDVIRGGNASLFSESTAAETANNGGGYLSAFATDGFTVTAGGSGDNAVNNTSDTYVAWNWKANGAGVSNTDGSITSTVSANTDSGFSIVTYTGNGTSGATVGHGLGVTPAMIIYRARNSGVSENWQVWHKSLTNGTYAVYLNLTNGQGVGNFLAAPTSTVSNQLNTSSGLNASGTNYVAYCFAEVPGYSAFGSYTGNGSADGPFVYTGFRPAFVLGKASSGTNASTSNWFIIDSARNFYNVANLRLFPNLSIADNTQDILDFTSNGFKIRTTNSSENTSGTTLSTPPSQKTPLPTLSHDNWRT